MLLTPLEQFQIISLFSFKLFFLDFSFTNLILINIIVLIFFSTIVYFSSSDTNYLGETSFFFVPNNWQILLETTYDTISQLLFDNIKNQTFPVSTIHIRAKIIKEFKKKIKHGMAFSIFELRGQQSRYMIYQLLILCP